MDESLHGSTKVSDWRDPFYFRYRGSDYMVLGGNLNKGKGGQAVVTLYKAEDNSLMKWKYLGVLFQYENAGNIECPNFFELDGKWVLVISPHRKVEYFIGKFDGLKFIPEKQGIMDHSDNYYAPNSTVANGSRRVMWGWIRGFKDNQGWNGCLTLPRELFLSGGELRQRPVEEVRKLRVSDLKRVKKGQVITLENSSEGVELDITLEGKNPDAQVTFASSDNRKNFTINIGNRELDVAGVKSSLAENDEYRLRIFYDRSVVEVYVDDTVAVSKVQYEIQGVPSIEVVPRGKTKAEVQGWILKSSL
jgi:beta-fructofuranosidase